MAEMEVVSGNAIQAFCPDSEKSQVNASMTGTKVFKKGTGADVNVNGWLCIRVVPTIDCTYYFNSDSSKTFPLFAQQENLVFLTGNGITQATIAFGAGTASVQGM